MHIRRFRSVLAAPLLALGTLAGAADVIHVNPDNFVRAESDVYLAALAKNKDAFAKFSHVRELSPVAAQDVIRTNRDTLYSAAIFDLDAGPVTMPDAGKRFMSMQVIDQDQYTPMVNYRGGSYTLDRKKIGTRYVMVAVRTLVDPNDPKDVQQVHALQDAIKFTQKGGPGKLEIPNWDPVSQKKVREALLSLADTLPDTKGMFGARGTTDPVHRLIGAASAWGGNPQKDAIDLNVVPPRNDGKTVHRIHVKNVPVDGFWSISVYNAKGYYEANPLNSYTINSVTGKKSADGSVAVQSGGCDGKVPNCIPIVPGWNYMVRLYRPHAEILNGKWSFPKAQPVS